MSGFLMEEKNFTISVTSCLTKPKEREASLPLPTEKLNTRFPLLPSAKSYFARKNSILYNAEGTGSIVSCDTDTFTNGNLDIADNSVASSATTNTFIWYDAHFTSLYSIYFQINYILLHCWLPSTAHPILITTPFEKLKHFTERLSIRPLQVNKSENMRGCVLNVLTKTVCLSSSVLL